MRKVFIREGAIVRHGITAKTWPFAWNGETVCADMAFDAEIIPTSDGPAGQQWKLTAPGFGFPGAEHGHGPIIAREEDLRDVEVPQDQRIRFISASQVMPILVTLDREALLVLQVGALIDRMKDVTQAAKDSVPIEIVQSWLSEMEIIKKNLEDPRVATLPSNLRRS